MTTPLNDLTHRLTMLAAPCGCTVTVRLMGGPRGGAVELRATRLCDGEAKEYTRQLSLRTIARHSAAVTEGFMREARLALAAASVDEQSVTRARLRRARR